MHYPPSSCRCGRTADQRVGRPRVNAPCAGLLQVVPQLLGARGMAQLAQGLDLDLADALAGHAKALADLLQGALVAVDEPKAELEHAALAWDEGVESGLDCKVEHGHRSGVRGGCC